MKKFNTYLTEKLRINKDTELGDNQFSVEVVDFIDSINDMYKNYIDESDFLKSLNIFFNKHKEIKGLNVYLSEDDNRNLDLNKSFNLINNVYTENEDILDKLDTYFRTTFYKTGFEVLISDWGIEIKDYKNFKDKIYFIDKDTEIKNF